MNAWEEVYKALTECDLFCGVHDATNGKKAFMHGIYAVMNYVAYEAGKEDEYDALWTKNILESERRAEGNDD